MPTAKSTKKKPMLSLFPELESDTADLSDAQFGALMRAIFGYRFAGTEYSGDDPMVRVAFRFASSQVERYEDYMENLREANSARAKKRWENSESTEDSENLPASASPDPSPCVGADAAPCRSRRGGRAEEADAAECRSMPKDAAPCQSMHPSPSPNPNPSPSPNPNPGLNQKEAQERTGKNPQKPPAEKQHFVPPSSAEIRKYEKAMGFDDQGSAIFDYYQGQGWCLANGNPMRDWQAVVRQWHRRDQEHLAKAPRGQPLKKEKDIPAVFTPADVEVKRQGELRRVLEEMRRG